MAPSREQAALAGVVVAGTAVGALLLRPAHGLFASGTGPLGGSGPIVVLLAIGWLVGGVVLARRHRARIADDPGAPPARARLTEAVRVALPAAALGFPLLLLVLHRFSGRGGASGGDPDDASRRTFRPPPGSGGYRGLIRPDVHGGGFDPVPVLAALAIALLAAVAVWAALVLWRVLRRVPAGPSSATYGTSDEDDEQRLLARAVDSGRRALLDGDDPRAAVIACYAAMEESLAASGVARLASDSPQDLMDRAAAGGLLTGPDVTTLTALFREARYSTHPMTTAHRDRAAAALTAIGARLAGGPDRADARADTRTETQMETQAAAHRAGEATP